VCLEATGDNEVRARQFLRLDLDPERLNTLPNVGICVVLFGVCEPGPGLAGDEKLTG